MAGSIGMVLTSTLTPAELLAWGWRVPFAVGMLLIPAAVYLRREMPETLEQGHTASSGGVPPTLGAHRRLIVLSILAVMGGTVSTYVGNYMTT